MADNNTTTLHWYGQKRTYLFILNSLLKKIFEENFLNCEMFLTVVFSKAEWLPEWFLTIRLKNMELFDYKRPHVGIKMTSENLLEELLKD